MTDRDTVPLNHAEAGAKTPHQLRDHRTEGVIPIEKEEKRVNWKKIKAEYLAGDISYRKLADKYGVSEAALTRKAVKDEWAKKRDEVRSKSEAKAKQKIVEKTAETMADNAEIASDIKHSLLCVCRG